MKVLENRLEKANQKFNETIGTNKYTRGEIDALRKEKVIFENMYGKLETQLAKKRTELNDIIEVANNAYEDRDKLQAKMANLIQQSEKEQNEFDQEIKTVQDLISKDDHMKTKIQKNKQINGEE